MPTSFTGGAPKEGSAAWESCYSPGRGLDRGPFEYTTPHAALPSFRGSSSKTGRLYTTNCKCSTIVGLSSKKGESGSGKAKSAWKTAGVPIVRGEVGNAYLQNIQYKKLGLWDV